MESVNVSFFKPGRGFTLIELLVVVAIVAALTTVVLMNVSGSISKGKDASAKENLSNATTKAGIFYDENSDYEGWITAGNGSTGDPSWMAIYDALAGANGAGYTITASCDQEDCGPGALKWCAQITLKETNSTYCVDSAGSKVEKAGGTCSAGECL